MILAGIDLAWRGNNPSAIAIGELRATFLSVLSVEARSGNAMSIAAHLLQTERLSGVAVDAPLTINNPSGQRPCETALGKAYGSRGCSCHTSNIGLYPNAESVQLSVLLEKHGFNHLGGKKWQVECYPHPAIVNLFQLPHRLQYKKGNVRERRDGQKLLATRLQTLSGCGELRLQVDGPQQQILDSEYIDSLRGRALKLNEDKLDSIVCLYIAGLYAIGHPGVFFGDTLQGYIWVPNPFRTEQRRTQTGYS